MKYNAFNKKWREIKGRPKEGIGLTPEESSLLDQVLSDANTNLKDAICSDPNVNFICTRKLS